MLHLYKMAGFYTPLQYLDVLESNNLCCPTNGYLYLNMPYEGNSEEKSPQEKYKTISHLHVDLVIKTAG